MVLIWLTLLPLSSCLLCSKATIVRPKNEAIGKIAQFFADPLLWRKGSFGTQSAEGSRFVESMMTVVATLKQQQRNVLEYLTAACEAALRGEAAPSLLPASDQKAHAAA